jgi:hypothetical protein
MPLQYLTSRKGQPQLLFGGFRYVLERDRNGKRNWKCINYYREHCTGRCQSMNDTVLLTANHNHDPSNDEAIPVSNPLQHEASLPSVFSTPQKGGDSLPEHLSSEPDFFSTPHYYTYESSHEPEDFIDARLKVPSNAIISGPTQSGKTELMTKILLHRKILFSEEFDRIVWSYTHWQPAYDRIKQLIPNIEWVVGFPPTLYETFDPSIKTLLVADDAMGTCEDLIAKIFTMGSHHLSLSIFYLVQNFFTQSKHSRTISLNAHYIFLLKNPRERSQVGFLARQMFPTNVRYMQAAFNDATKEPHSYLMVDCRQESNDAYRLRTSILPGETQYVYLPK